MMKSNVSRETMLSFPRKAVYTNTRMIQGRNTLANIIAIANGINLFILTFEKTYFLPKNDTPKVKANNNMKYNIHLKKFNINILLS